LQCFCFRQWKRILTKEFPERLLTVEVFVLGEQRLVEDAFRNGGLSKVSVHTIATRRRFSSSTEAVKALQDDFHGSAITELPNSEREHAWQEVEQQLRGFEGPNGCELPGELLIGVGTK
jgi:hypothetical protein